MENQIFRENVDGFALMYWEQNPQKRNINNVVKFNVKQNISVNIGDLILGMKEKEYQSIYAIEEIIEERPSSIAGKKYVTVKTKWYNEKVTNN